MIKTTNGGGGNSVLVVKDKAQLDIAKVVKKLNKWLKIPMGISMQNDIIVKFLQD